ncbi:hypothetical protein [Streptomyces atratus]
MADARGFTVPGGAGAGVVPAGGRQSLPWPLYAVLFLVRALFLVTAVGGIGVLTLASSVDAVDGRLLGPG